MELKLVTIPQQRNVCFKRPSLNKIHSCPLKPFISAPLTLTLPPSPGSSSVLNAKIYNTICMTKPLLALSWPDTVSLRASQIPVRTPGPADPLMTLI